MNNWFVSVLKEHKALLCFIILMGVFRSSVADWNTVPTGSMKPTIVEGDRILVNKLAYDLRIPFTHVSLVKVSDPLRGDIVVFDSQASGKRLVKRVIGLPGDTVQMSNNVLSINGEQLNYSQLTSSDYSQDRSEYLFGTEHVVRVRHSGSSLSSFEQVVVPDNTYLTLGDNRDNSADSRVIGFIPRNEIVGRTQSVVMSFNYDNYYIPRSERFFHQLVVE